MWDMWELFAVLIGLGLVLWFVVVPVLLVVLWTRVGQLETDLRRLRAEQRRPAQPRPGEVPRREPPPAPAEERPAPRPVEPAEQADMWLPVPEERQRTGPGAPRPLGEPVAEPRPSRKAGTFAPAERPEARREEDHSTLEELLAGRWLTWVGALAVVIGAGFFFRYAIEHELIGPAGRVMVGLLVGMGCFAGGAYAMLRDYRLLAQGLVGAAIGILYFSLYAAWDWYRLVPQPVAFAGMVAVTAAAIAFSAYFNAQPAAVLGLIGGFLTPLMLSTGEDAQWTLFSYILLLDFGVLGVATFRKWQTLQSLAFAGTLLIWLSWFEVHYEPAKLVSTVILMTAFFALFALLAIWHNVLRRMPAQPADFFLILATPIAYFIGLYAVTDERYAWLHGLMAVGLGGVYLAMGALALVKNPAGRNIVLALGGIAASFLTIAIPLQLTGHWIAIAWAAESLLLVELGLRFKEIRLRQAGFGLMAVVMLILAYYSLTTFADPTAFQTRDWTRFDPVVQTAEPHWTDVFNGRSFSFLAATVALAVMAWEYRRRNLSEQAAGWMLIGVPLTLLMLTLVETYALGYPRGWITPTYVGWFSVWTALAGFVLIVLAVGRGPRWIEGAGLAVFCLLGLFVLINFFNTLADWRGHWHRLQLADDIPMFWRWPAVNPRGIGLLTTIAAAATAAVLLHRNRAGRQEDRPDAAAALGVFAHLTGLALITTEVYAQGVIHDWRTATALAITLAWTLYAIGTLVAGIYWQSGMVRVLALSLFMLTTAKVFLYDVWHLDPTIRTFAFMGLGVSLLLVSFLYRRYRVRIREWMTPAALLIAAAWCAAGPAAAIASDPPANDRAADLLQTLPYRWPVSSADDGERQRLVRIVLPPDLYGQARPDLGDLRVLAADEGERGASAPWSAEESRAVEVPYVLLRPTDATRTVERPAPLLNLSEVGGSTEFVLDLQDAVEPVNELKIEVHRDEENYERPVRVFGAHRLDADQWNLLTRDGYLLDVKRPGHRQRVERVSFPQSRFRYYRVVIDNQDEPPLRIDGASLYDREQSRVPRREYPADVVSVERLAEEKRTRVTFDLRYVRLPTDGLRVEIEYDGDFYRPARLEAADRLDDRRAWRQVTSAQLYRISRPGLEAVHEQLEYSETPARYLRLTIDDGDDRPLTITGGRALGIEQAAVIERRHITDGPQRTLALYAGDRHLSTPRYDLARTVGPLTPGDIPAVGVAPQEKNPFYTGPAPRVVPWTEEHQALLWTITIAGILVLGLLTVLLLRKAATAYPPESGEP